MIVDYFLLRRCRLDSAGLYLLRGPYAYSNGVNWRAVASLGAGALLALLGLAIPPLRWVYDYAWFVGFAVSGATYYLAMGAQRSVATRAARVASVDVSVPNR